MRNEAIGYIACPECGHDSAEVREDKKRNPYRHCTECGAAYFSHGGARGAALRARMKPIQQPEPDPEPSPAPDPEPVPVPPKKKSFLEELLS